MRDIKLLKPDVICGDVTDITPEMLKEMNIDTVLTDIDNTLALPHDRIPFEYSEAWLKSLRDVGIRVVAVSNNTEDRVSVFCDELKLEYISRAAKPLAHRIRAACGEKDIDLKRSAVVGDQIFTDVLGARLLRVKALLVTPRVHERETLFKIKRALERLILKNKEWCR